MTALERMAQLVSNLRKLGVIVEGDIVDYDVEEGMTQLVDDLQKLDLIAEGDTVGFFYNPEGPSFFAINIKSYTFPRRSLDVQAIKNAVEKEFQKEAIYLPFDKKYQIYYQIKL